MRVGSDAVMDVPAVPVVHLPLLRRRHKSYLMLFLLIVG